MIWISLVILLCTFTLYCCIRVGSLADRMVAEVNPPENEVNE